MIMPEMQTYLYQPGDYPMTMQAVYNQPEAKIFNQLEYKVGKWPKNAPQVKHLWNNGAYLIYNDQQVLAYGIIVDQNQIAWNLLVHLLRYAKKELMISFEIAKVANSQWLTSPEFSLVN